MRTKLLPVEVEEHRLQVQNDGNSASSPSQSQSSQSTIPFQNFLKPTQFLHFKIFQTTLKMAPAAVLSPSQTFPSDTAVNGFHEIALSKDEYKPPTFGDASDSTDGTLPSEEERNKQIFADKWKAAYESGSIPTSRTATVALPHEASIQESIEPLTMSWWPVSDDLMVVNSFEPDKLGGSTPVMPRPKQRQPSIFKKLEARLGEFIHGQHGTKAAAASPGGDVDIDTRVPISSSPTTTLKLSGESDSLYHVVLTTSHLKKDVNVTVQGVRVCGTFDALQHAKAFAHRCLFEAGYEQEWFTMFKTQHDLRLVDHKEDKIVEATGPAGELFTVNISTIPNSFGLKSSSDSKRITTPLFHVVQTIVKYGEDESGQTRDTTIQGSYTSYERAREIAHSLLLWFEDGINKDTYLQYEEAAPGELDCGYGENVVVHAVGENGSNYLVSILKSDELEAERVREAATAMRS
jgi:hypothetical protein